MWSTTQRALPVQLYTMQQPALERAQREKLCSPATVLTASMADIFAYHVFQTHSACTDKSTATYPPASRAPATSAGHQKRSVLCCSPRWKAPWLRYTAPRHAQAWQCLLCRGSAPVGPKGTAGEWQHMLCSTETISSCMSMCMSMCTAAAYTAGTERMIAFYTSALAAHGWCNSGH